MADDPHMAAWRAKQQMSGGAGGAGGSSGGNPQQSAAAAEERKKKEAAMEEQRRLMLKQILSDEAGERLANIRLVKPDKARQVEDVIINAARTGRLSEKLSDDRLKELLSQVSEQTDRRSKVTISRRRSAFDEDDDFDDEEF